MALLLAVWLTMPSLVRPFVTRTNGQDDTRWWPLPAERDNPLPHLRDRRTIDTVTNLLGRVSGALNDSVSQHVDNVKNALDVLGNTTSTALRTISTLASKKAAKEPNPSSSSSSPTPSANA